MKKISKQNGITLIALIVSVIILVILASISINIVLNSGLIDRTERGADLYQKESAKEQDELDKVDDFTKKITSKSPVIEKVEVKTRIESNLKIIVTAKAKDELGDNLTYKLYIGENEENLVEQVVLEDVESGIEVSLEKDGFDEEKQYYYYITVTNGVKESTSEIQLIKINAKPTITSSANTNITVNSNPLNSTSYIEVSVTGIDVEKEDLTYRVYLGTKAVEELGENDLIRK